MENYFSVQECQIPMELKPLYQEISDTFENKVFDAIKNNNEKGNKNEETKKIS